MSGRVTTMADAQPSAEVERLKRDTGYAGSVSALKKPLDIPETRGGPTTGVFVRGIGVRDAVSSPPGDRVVVRPGVDGTVVGLLGDPPRGESRSLSVRFENGSGTVIAALPRFWAVVSVDEGAVVNVSYIPSRAHFLRGEYDS